MPCNPGLHAYNIFSHEQPSYMQTIKSGISKNDTQSVPYYPSFSASLAILFLATWWKSITMSRLIKSPIMTAPYVPRKVGGSEVYSPSLFANMSLWTASSCVREVIMMHTWKIWWLWPTKSKQPGKKRWGMSEPKKKPPQKNQIICWKWSARLGSQ